MADNLQVPINVDDKVVLKRFLTTLVNGLNSNPYYQSTVTSITDGIIQAFQSNPNLNLLSTVSNIEELRNDIRAYVEDSLETNILQNKENIALIAEQFGTFYDQALAASWYGLSVKAGGAIAGLEVGSLDPDVTTPGDESSYFRVIADNFVVGRAYDDLTQAEKDYLDNNGLPRFGTVYNVDKTPLPALAITWDSINQTYKHYFNGVVEFSNLNGVPDYALTSELSNYILASTYSQDITSLQNQIDGSISTWFYNGEPTLSNTPAVDWTDNEIKNIHLGDIYYDNDTGYAYRFAYEDIEDGPDLGIIYSWIRITDSDITQALQAASNAQSTADGKITTFYQASEPTAEGIGDIWINTSDNNKVYIWDSSSWVYTRDTSKDAEIAQALYTAASAQETADNKIISFFQDSEPIAGSLGDIWFDTNDGNKTYRYNGTSWVAVQDNLIAQAISDAADAQSTADGKITAYYDTQANRINYIGSDGDFFISTDSSVQYIWISGGWSAIDPAVAINNGSSTINGDVIETGTLNADRIGAGVIYNTGGSATGYTMKIDLDNGEIHIL